MRWSEALKIILRVADEVGCRCIITDAYRDKVDWYARLHSDRGGLQRTVRRKCS